MSRPRFWTIGENDRCSGNELTNIEDVSETVSKSSKQMEKKKKPERERERGEEEEEEGGGGGGGENKSSCEMFALHVNVESCLGVLDQLNFGKRLKS